MTSVALRAAASSTVVSPPSPSLPRDRALDALRGWAIVLMILSHVGSHTPLCTLAHLPLWVSAADPFIVLSGIVLGMRARRGPVRGLGRRTFQIYRAHVVMMVAIIVVHQWTGRLRVPSVQEAGGYLSMLWMVPTLRLQSLDFANILPLFIVFFVASPAFIAAMRAGSTGAGLALSIGLWAVAQRCPEFLRFTDPVSGPQVFVLLGWQLAFIVGLTVGFHRLKLAELWHRHRRVSFSCTVALVGTVFVLAQLQRGILERFGAHLPQAADWLFAKETWGPVRAVYVSGLMLLAYLGLSRFRSRLRVAPLRFTFDSLELIGKNSLYCFFAHLPFALVASAVHFDDLPMVIQQPASIGVIAAVFLMAKHRILWRYIPS